jgi:hypothetical protein
MAGVLGFKLDLVSNLSFAANKAVNIGGLQMQPKNNKRFYTPQFSEQVTVTVRRLACAMGKPMPAAVDIMVKLLPSIVSPSKVCQLCKDKQACHACTFSKQPDPQEFSVLEAVL